MRKTERDKDKKRHKYEGKMKNTEKTETKRNTERRKTEARKREKGKRRKTEMIQGR